MIGSCTDVVSCLGFVSLAAALIAVAEGLRAGSRVIRRFSCGGAWEFRRSGPDRAMRGSMEVACDGPAFRNDTEGTPEETSDDSRSCGNLRISAGWALADPSWTYAPVSPGSCSGCSKQFTSHYHRSHYLGLEPRVIAAIAGITRLPNRVVVGNGPRNDLLAARVLGSAAGRLRRRSASIRRIRAERRRASEALYSSPRVSAFGGAIGASPGKSLCPKRSV